MEARKEILNILIISLDEKFTKDVSSHLASELEMFSVDCKEFVEYDLINPKDVLDKCGLEYLRKRERGALSSVCEYHNTVISINYDLFKRNFDLFEYSLIVYLKLDDKFLGDIINTIEEKNYNEFLLMQADIQLEVNEKDEEEVKNNLLNLLGENL